MLECEAPLRQTPGMTYERLLSLRLAPPAFRVDLLARPQLLERLRAPGDAQMTIVAAPAGYGKTSLLSQWRMRQLEAGHRIAWLNGGGLETDPPQFLADLILALSQGGAALGQLPSQAEQGFADTPIRALVSSLLRALLQETRPITLIIDDVHRLPADSVEQVLNPLVSSLPPALQLVLSGRERPTIGVAELRGRGQLIEVQAAELRFNLEEARHLLPELPEGPLQGLLAITEGWPVALQLCKLWLAREPRRASLIPKFSGRVLEIAEYLTEQVLADLPEDALAILQDVSILESFNADLIEALGGASENWFRLLRAHKLESFLMPLDDEQYWYRLHHLLSDFLAGRLRESQPERVLRLHAAASAWFESHGMLREAVQHATAAGDHARTAALIDRAGSWEMVIHGGYGLMRTLLRFMPKERERDFPRVYFAKLLQLAKEGRVQEAMESFNAYRRQTEDFTQLVGAPPSSVKRDALMVKHLLCRYADVHLAPDAIAQIYRECEELDPSDGVGRSALLNTACLIGLGLGDMQVARVACQRAIESLRRIGSVLGVNYCYLHLGQAHLHLGERREAEAMFRESLAMAEENFGVDSGLKAMSDVYLGFALYGRGDIAGAQAHIFNSLENIETGDGWFDAYADVYEILMAMDFHRGGVAAVESVVDRALLTAKRRGQPRLESLAHALHARFAAAAGELTAASVALAKVQPAYSAARWTHDPFWWRSDFAAGSAIALLHLAEGQLAEGEQTLGALHEACTQQRRFRQRAVVTALQCAVRFRAGRQEEAARTLAGALEDRLVEDDLQPLVDLGAVLVPVAQFARKWALESGVSAQARRALGQLADRGADVSVQDAQSRVLSPRELEVLIELARGAPNKTIARALQMTENTVKFHLKNIFLKLGVQHRAAAIRAGREQGLLS